MTWKELIPTVSLFSPGPVDLGEEAGARFLVGWALRLAPMQPKSSGSSRFLVNILTNLPLPRYVAFRFVVSDTRKWTRRCKEARLRV